MSTAADSSVSCVGCQHPLRGRIERPGWYVGSCVCGMVYVRPEFPEHRYGVGIWHLLRRVRSVQPRAAGFNGVVFDVEFDYLTRSRCLKITVPSTDRGEDDITETARRMDAVGRAFPSVHVVELHRTPDNLPYFVTVMERLEYPTLRVLLAADSVPLRTRQNIALNVASNVALLHRNGVSHGDIWLDNILVAESGEQSVLIDPSPVDSLGRKHEDGRGWDIQRLACVADALVPQAECRFEIARRIRDGESLNVGAVVERLKSAVVPATLAGVSAELEPSVRRLEERVPSAARRFYAEACKRIRDCDLLVETYPVEVRSRVGGLSAIVLEACHLLDDFYDDDAKWSSHGYGSPEYVVELAAIAARQVATTAEAADLAIRAIEDANFWMRQDSSLSEAMTLAAAARRVRECNGRLYTALKRMGDAMGRGTASEIAFERVGELAWYCDDWRDLELDNAESQFNAFKKQVGDVAGQVSAFREVISNILNDVENEMGRGFRDAAAQRFEVAFAT
jgi:hypothetical protein